MIMKVPFADLKAQYISIKSEIDLAIEDILINTSFVGGAKVKAFEAEFASYIGTEHCISCANGTDAIEIALQAMGIGKGDEVIVPAMSWFATSEAVTTVGAKPIFADVLMDEWTIDPADIRDKITKNTKAIIPVHFYGRAARMVEIMAIATEFALKVVEDSAQAHGAAFGNQNIGTFGDAATFSFYPGKNLGAYGDAGAIVTNNDDLAHTCRLITNHGMIAKHDHRLEGRNSRMDTLQASVLSVKLKHLEGWTEQRIKHAQYYNEQLSSLSLRIPLIQEEHKHVFHVYVIQVRDRMKVKTELANRGVATQVHYPQALPALIPYQSKFDVSDFPVAKSLAAEGLSLPIFPEMTKDQIDFIVGQLKEVLDS